MKRIYIIGHGLMSPKTARDKFLLKHKLYTYCKEGTMLEGNKGVSSIIDTGYYVPDAASSQDDAQAGTQGPLSMADMHYVYGGTTTMADLAHSRKFAAVNRAAMQRNKIVLDQGAGELLPIGADEYLYCTVKTTLTGLNIIQFRIAPKLPGQQFVLHWAVCRSYIGGTNAAERLAYARHNGLDGGGLTRILR